MIHRPLSIGYRSSNDEEHQSSPAKEPSTSGGMADYCTSFVVNFSLRSYRISSEIGGFVEIHMVTLASWMTTLTSLLPTMFYFKQNLVAIHDLLSLVLTAKAEVTRFSEILPTFWVFLAGLKVDFRRTLGRYPKHAI